MSLVDFVRGRVVERGPDSVVLAVGGFGVRVVAAAATAASLSEPGEEALLYTHLQVREDALTLYGFATREERALFNQLISVSGVGPKVALGALSAMPAERLAAAIGTDDVDALAKLPGIGRKTASRIVLDLKGKLVTGAPAAEGGRAGGDGVFDTAAVALKEYGFGPSEIAAAIAALPRDRPLTEEEAVAQAFRHLGSRK